MVFLFLLEDKSSNGYHLKYKLFLFDEKVTRKIETVNTKITSVRRALYSEPYSRKTNLFGKK